MLNCERSLTLLDRNWRRLSIVSKLIFKNEGLKKDLENGHVAHDAAVRDKVEVHKAERTKLQWF
jgi:hypothetical protein